MLVAEIPPGAATLDVLGLALARQVAVADHCFAETTEWLKGGGWPAEPAIEPAEGAAPGPGPSLLLRYATELDDLLDGVQRPGVGSVE